MNRYEKIQQAKEDFAKGLISEEEFRDIMEDCDYDEIKQEAEYEDEEYEWFRISKYVGWPYR